MDNYKYNRSLNLLINKINSGTIFENKNINCIGDYLDVIKKEFSLFAPPNYENCTNESENMKYANFYQFQILLNYIISGTTPLKNFTTSSFSGVGFQFSGNRATLLWNFKTTNIIMSYSLFSTGLVGSKNYEDSNVAERTINSNAYSTNGSYPDTENNRLYIVTSSLISVNKNAYFRNECVPQRCRKAAIILPKDCGYKALDTNCKTLPGHLGITLNGNTKIEINRILYLTSPGYYENKNLVNDKTIEDVNDGMCNMLLFVLNQEMKFNEKYITEQKHE